MAGNRSGSVTIDVSARLQVLQSSVSEIQKVLDKLEPKSARFKELSGIVANIRKGIDQVQIQSAKGLVSQNQFNQLEKQLDNIDDAFSKAALSIQRLNFKDIKLDSNQLATFKQFEKELGDIKQALDNTKEEIRQAFVMDEANNGLLKAIDPTLVNKNLNQISSSVESQMRRVNKEYNNATNQVEQYNKAIQTASNIEKFIKQSKSGAQKDKTLQYTLENALGADTYEQYFKANGQFKSQQKDAFFQRIQEMFTLDESQMSQIRNLTGPKINELFSQILEDASKNNGTNFFQQQLDAATKAQAQLHTTETAQQNKSAELTTLTALYERLKEALGQVASAERNATAAAIATNVAIENERKSIEDSNRSLGEQASLNQDVTNSLANLRSELAQTNAQFLKQQQAINTFNSIRSTITNFMGFNQVLNLTRNAVREAANHIRELDTTMNGIAVVTKMTTADLWAQVDTYTQMAQRYGVTIQGAYEVSKIYYQAGYQTNEVLTLMNETLKLSKISGLDYATTTDYMMTATRGFKLEIEDASRVVDVYSALAASTAVSTQELAEAMTRTASSMESVGSSFEETSAMMATVIAVTRESANNIGSAFKSIASRYGEMKKDPSALVDSEGEAMAFNKVDAALQSVGINMKTVDGQFRSFTEVIVELADKWDSLTSVQQRYIATQFAGNRDVMLAVA